MKKLKGLGAKNYNVLFHAHTVAGIVISFALFVIFYAGAFSLFRADIAQWENPDLRQPYVEHFDYEQAINKVDSIYGLNFYENINIKLPTEVSPVMYVYGAYNDTDTTTQRVAAYVSPKDMKVQDIKEPLTTVSSTLYYLHFFQQIPVLGLYLSGFVGLFFLFSVVTGVLIHWRNLLTKFYAFISEGKWKVIWTNLHTVLGVIGLPFQVMYAITGAFFGLLTLILLPTLFLLYEGDREKLFNKITPSNALEVQEDSPAYEHYSLSELAEQVKHAYPTSYIQRLQLRNYGKEDALAVWGINQHEGILSSGSLAMRMKNGEILEDYSTLPNQKTYSYSVIDFLFKLHFGDFGGHALRIVYFILSMITCFIIISGVLIWRTARDNKQYTLSQRIFHHRVTKIYLAICLSMFPAFALIFITNKIIPMDWESRTRLVNTIFFSGWLLLTVAGSFWNNYARQNKNYLLLGGVLALFVPIINGVVTGDWVWNTWAVLPTVAYVDIFWLMSGGTALYLVFFVLKKPKGTDFPVDLGEKIAMNEFSPKRMVEAN